MWACLAGGTAAGWSATAGILLVVTMVLIIAGQVLAGVQYLRPSGARHGPGSHAPVGETSRGASRASASLIREVRRFVFLPNSVRSPAIAAWEVGAIRCQPRSPRWVLRWG